MTSHSRTRRRYPSRLPDRGLDDGTLRVTGVHLGDGYYSVTCTCRACGDGATRTLTARKEHYNGIMSGWFQEHWHNP